MLGRTGQGASCGSSTTCDADCDVGNATRCLIGFATASGHMGMEYWGIAGRIGDVDVKKGSHRHNRTWQ